jgi:hypothetical protein
MMKLGIREPVTCPDDQSERETIEFESDLEKRIRDSKYE